jgi:hypothetical protein
MKTRLAAVAAALLLSLSVSGCDKCGNWFGQKTCGTSQPLR